MTIGINLQGMLDRKIHNAMCSTDDRLNLSRETKKRPSQRAGKTYSAVQKNLEAV
jgi:hypothetical protein